MRKYCLSPPRTGCMYQQMAHDQADDPGATSDAYDELCRLLSANLSPDDMAQAEQLLTRLLDKTDPTDAMDDPMAFEPRPTASAMDADLRRRVAIGQRITAKKFAQRFPGASRIRNIG